MKIIFLLKGDRMVASSRLRGWEIAGRLKKEYGIEYEILHSIGYPLFHFSKKRMEMFSLVYKKISAIETTHIFVQKSLFPLDLVLAIIFVKKFYKKKLIYDLDDAEWRHSYFKTALLSYFADVIFACSHVAIEYLNRFNKNIKHVPTSVDSEVYFNYKVNPRRKDKFTFVWVGAPSHFHDGNMDMLLNVFKRLSEKKFSFRFVVMTAPDKKFKEAFSGQGYEFIFRDNIDWANDPAANPRIFKEYDCDVGFMPLLDTPFERGKCAYKAIEYMACGIIPIVSRVGENNYVIEENYNGFFADGEDEIEMKIEKALSDLEKRSIMSKNAIETVKLKYSFKSSTAEISRTLSKL